MRREQLLDYRRRATCGFRLSIYTLRMGSKTAVRSVASMFGYVVAVVWVEALLALSKLRREA